MELTLRIIFSRPQRTFGNTCHKVLQASGRQPVANSSPLIGFNRNPSAVVSYDSSKENKGSILMSI